MSSHAHCLKVKHEKPSRAQRRTSQMWFWSSMCACIEKSNFVLRPCSLVLAVPSRVEHPRGSPDANPAKLGFLTSRFIILVLKVLTFVVKTAQKFLHYSDKLYYYYDCTGTLIFYQVRGVGAVIRRIGTRCGLYYLAYEIHFFCPREASHCFH